jgi:uncharacterized protein (DUF433 family)
MKAAHLSLIESGIYTIPQAALLVEADVRALRVWVEGRKNKQDPVIENQLGRLGHTVAVSFTNLVELRFVSTFVKAGVRLNAIRSIMDEVKDILGNPHPFATETVFKTDGKKIVAEIAKKNGATVVYDLRSKNYEMHVVVLASLKENVIWSPMGDAVGWFPRPELATHVMVHRSFSFGKPVLRDSRIPTEALSDSYKAEKSTRRVAELFDVPEKQVKEAVRFQEHLRKAA